MVGYCFKNKIVINIDDPYSDSRFNKEVDIKTGYRTNSILEVPVRDSKEKVIGVF